MAMLSGVKESDAAIYIVALGASNTAGTGVGTKQAFPAQLEAMLSLRSCGVPLRA